MDCNYEEFVTPQNKTLKDENVAAVDKPRTASLTPNSKASVEKKVGGGGGADSSHGLVFHLTVAMLMLFSLREMSQADLGLQYHIWLEKAGYGKFDDIVVRFKKSGGNWIEICVQCKHGEEKVSGNGEKSVNSVTADDLFKNKQFSVLEYFKSFRDVEAENKECEKYYIILTNRAYDDEKDSKYPFLQRQEIVDLNEIFAHGILIKNGFHLACNNELVCYFCSKANLGNNIVLNECLARKFCENFFYIHDNRDLESLLDSKLSSHCKNIDESKNLRARLYYLVSQMYQRKIDPDENDLSNEFSRSIYYNVHRVHAQFAGRVTQIQEIKDALENDGKRHMFDLLVTGMAGMGKTQLVLKYIDENKQQHKNIIWINAESKETLENAFHDIAKQCQLESDMNEIYSYLNKDTLFVFDNADSSVLLSKNDRKEYIYLPNNAQCIGRNKFMIISQDKNWTTSCTVNVDKFSTEDALEYLDAKLKCSQEDKLKLAETYQYWPLALSIAVSYIESQTDIRLGLKSYSDIISALEADNANLHKYSPREHEMEAYTESLKSLWLRIRTKLESKEQLALEIVEIMSLSDPDNFPINLLKFEGIGEEDVKRAVLFLLDQSLVTFCDAKMSIHRTLQSVIRNSVFFDMKHFEHILLLGIKCFTNYLNSMIEIEKMQSIGNMHIATFLNILLESKVDIQLYIELARRLLKKLKQNDDIGSHCKPNAIYENMVTKIEQKLAGIQLQTPDLLFETAFILLIIEKFEESLNLFNYLVEINTKELGENHTETLKIIHITAEVLYALKNYDEALSLFAKVIELRREILGNSHIDTLKSICSKANILEEMKNYAEALSLYEQLIELYGKEVGNEHPYTLSCMNRYAELLFQMKKYEDALRVCDQVTELAKENTSTNLRNYVDSINRKAVILMNLAKYEEARDLFNQISETINEKIHENSLYILNTMLHQADVLMRMGKFEDFLSICDQINEISKEKLSGNHPVIHRCLRLKEQYLRVIETMHIWRESMKLISLIPFPELETFCKYFLETNNEYLITVVRKIVDLYLTGQYFPCIATCWNLLAYFQNEIFSTDIGWKDALIIIYIAASLNIELILLYFCLDIFEVESPSFLYLHTVYIFLEFYL